MKFPFDFSITLVFRLVFPGIVLATATLPFFLGFFGWVGLLGDGKITVTVLVPITAVIFGWLIVLCDAPIYMFLEGRAYLPAWILFLMQKCQARRLERIRSRYAKFTKEGKTRRASEVNAKKLDYPIDKKTGEFYAGMPTRLGNLLYAYETYTNTAYKLDSIFYWSRLWLALDKDLRGAIDETQAMADSAVYVCFACYASFAILVIYGLGGFVARSIHYSLFNLPYLPSPGLTLLLSLLPLVIGYGCYRVAIWAQRGYGELFKALFDMYRDKLTFVDGVTAIAVKLGGDPKEADKFTVTSRYLRWHKIRPPGHKNISPEKWAQSQPAAEALPVPQAGKPASLWSRLLYQLGRKRP